MVLAVMILALPMPLYCMDGTDAQQNCRVKAHDGSEEKDLHIGW